MNNPDLTALADEIERAEGPSRGLDARIALAVGYTTYPDGYGDGNEWVDPQGNHLPRAVRMGAQPPKFSASIDAALTLVPEGWAWTTACYWCEGESAPPYYADCADLSALVAGQDAPVFEAKSSSPALALCAAAIRAKAGAA